MRFRSTPGAHGGDAVSVARWLGVDAAAIVDLSASLNPVAPDAAAVVRAAAGSVVRYPDPNRATAVLADALGVSPDLVVLTNGGSEAIALVAAQQPVGWVEHPEFALYERHLRRLDPTAPRWRSNPSNPLGRLAPPSAAAGVWDEAFWQLATGTWTRGDADAWRVGSLTKLWGCPGVRIGYAIAPDDRAADELRRRQPQWAVSSLATAVVEELTGRSDLPGWATAVRRRRSELVSLLATHGLVAQDTEACWVLVHRPGLRADLLPHGVLVRDCASFGLHGTHRIAVPDDRGAERLDAALRALAS